MRKRLVGSGLLLVAACAGTPPPPAAPPAAPPPIPTAAAPPPALTKKTAMPYPETRVDQVMERLFGVEVPDPYRWLEDGKAEEVRAWMEAQDRFARERLATLPGRDALAARLRSFYYLDSMNVPHRRGTRFFYSRNHADREKAIIYVRDGEQGTERVLLDPNTMSADGTISLGVWVPSWDGRRVAYTLRANASDESTLHVIDVATGKVSEVDVIEGAKYAHPSWTPSGDGFYYTYLPTDPKIPVADRPGWAEIRFHKVGADPKRDPVVHERTGSPQSFVGIEVSRDGHWLFFFVQHGWNSTDVYYRDLRRLGPWPGARGGLSPSKDPKWHPLVAGTPAQYRVEAWKDRFYVHTNEGAPRWRVLRVDPRTPARDRWQEIVAESADAVLENAYVIGGRLALVSLRHAHSELEIRTLDGKPVRKVELPGIGAVPELAGNPEDDDAYFSYTSFAVPRDVYRIALGSGETRRFASASLSLDASAFAVEQVFFPSKDGTKISMFLVHRKDLRRDGSTPFLLGGYGGFNVSMLPQYWPPLYLWLEAGGAYALPNLRGGGEYGEAWHQAGMGSHKQNVFDDFLAAAEFLVAEGYTRPERLAIRGGSNGGLLVGAALTQRPARFRAVICAVPLLDMVRYHLVGSGKTWIPEYGSAEDEVGFRTLHAYSPYHHVQAGTPYPSVLMLSADSDDRVDPMHARKMAAALQAASGSDRPVWLRIERNAGHGGADLVKQTLAQSADVLAFLMRELGMAPPASAAR